MMSRTAAVVDPALRSRTPAFLKAQKALDTATSQQRKGDLPGAILSCQEGIALVGDAQDSDALRLRVRLREQQQTVRRMQREERHAG